MNILTKRGQLDNIVTFEHYCDTHADLLNIDPQYITLGSIALVIEDETEGDALEVYMSNSSKEWIPILNGGGGSASGVPFVILDEDQYDSETGEPTIENAQENTFYLVPAMDDQPNNLFDEWFYVEEAWEKFGTTSVAVDGAQADWNEDDGESLAYINNKPPIYHGAGQASILFNHDYNTATSYAAIAEGSGTNAGGEVSHAEGVHSQALGNISHAEGNYSIAYGNSSHVEGNHTIAAKNDQHVSGKYNIADTTIEHAEIIGNGTSEQARSNARTLDWNGNEWLAGGLTVNGTTGVTIGNTTVTETQLQALLALLQ